MPGVVSVQPRVGSLLQQVAQGVSIARDVYGIKHEGDMADIAQQRADREKQAFDERGAATAKDLPYILKNARTVDEGTEGAIQVPVVGAPGEDSHSIYILPKKEQDYRQVNGVTDPATGKHGSGFVDVNDPSSGLVGFVEGANTQKEPTPHWSPVGIVDGNPVSQNTVTGEYKTGDLGGGFLGKGQKQVDPAKATADAEKVYTKMTTTMAQPGRNKAVQQAMVNEMSADNAMSLANKYQGNFNNMTPNDYQLFIGELSKISTGGIGSQHSQEALSAHTLASKWAAFKQQIGGDPTPAQLGSFIQGNVDYLKDLKSNSENVVNKYKLDIYNSFKNQLPAELQQRFMAEHGDLFQGQNANQPMAAGQPAPQGGGLVGTANAATGGGAGAHPQDSAAVSWAKQNILSPNATTASQARQILQLNGVK